MPIFAVSYAYADQPEELAEVRPTHRAFLHGLYAAGVLLASGPVASGNTRGALILVRAESATAALDLLRADPLLAAGLIIDRSAAKWTCIDGPWAEETGR